MLDNNQIKVFKPALDAGFAAIGHGEIVTKQNYQPTTQGVDDGPTLYFVKLPMDKRYGWPQRTYVLSDDGTHYVTTSRQFMESTWQFMGIFRQTAENTDGLTASDVANLGAGVLQHEDTLAALAEHGLTVLRITQVRNMQVVNGEGEFEANPNFDFVLLHEQVTVTTTPVATARSFGIKNV